MAQTRFPGLLPTPAQARLRLKDATSEEANARHLWEGLKEHQKAAKKEVEAAELELREVERILIDAVEDSPEARDAEKDQAKAWKRLKDAERGLENLKATHSSAQADWKEKRRSLMAAREDLEAIRQGRRKS